VQLLHRIAAASSQSAPHHEQPAEIPSPVGPYSLCDMAGLLAIPAASPLLGSAITWRSRPEWSRPRCRRPFAE
jgi:hypothetical protein